MPAPPRPLLDKLKTASEFGRKDLGVSKRGKGRKPVPEPPRRPQAPGPQPPGIEPKAKPGFVDQAIDLALHVLHHHLLIVLAAIAGTVVLVAVFLSLDRASDCLETETEYLKIRVGCPGHEDAISPGGKDKLAAFPRGVLADKPVTMLAEVAAVAFVSSDAVGGGKGNLWVYYLQGRTGTVEDFINVELGTAGKMRRVGGPLTAFMMAKFLSHSGGSAPTDTGGIDADSHVQLSRQVVSADHKNALLVWKSPYRGLNADIVGRVVVGSRGTYFVVAILAAAKNRTGEALKEQLQTMIQSLRVG